MTETKTERSAALFAEAQGLIPGGVNSPVRAFASVGGTPRFMARGAGARVWDVDGNEYIDYVMSWGPLIHGHAFRPVIDAVHRAAEAGTSFGAPTEQEVELARLVANAVPSIEMMRFVSSGTEATMSAIRLARGYTGRDLIVKFAGNYHGHADMLLAQAGSGSLTLGVPSSPGVPAAATAATLVARYNDPEGIDALFDAQRGTIAAVIVEPIAGNMGVVPPVPGFLETIRKRTGDDGALFICDEVITGFRVAYGGAQEVYDLRPDLTTLGKIIGGGLPVGAYGGRRDVMEQMAPVGPIYQAGTLSGNPLAMAAGVAALQPLADRELYQRLSAATERLVVGLRRAAADANVPVVVNAVTGMLTVFFVEPLPRDTIGSDGDRRGTESRGRIDASVRNGDPEPEGAGMTTLDAVQRSNTERYGQFFHAMLDRGVSLPPSQFEAWMLSTAHGNAEIDATIEVAAKAFRAIA